ncbi:putative ulp1 protease family, C-terminal catalytic domain-containing protein [Cinnamomum micranthum f. kanehirae]|uniref:Putative ulp1 protease family, C-terminal catalytic domain-containing protein n=1 Tax=Cinnamomum micranthum f. kanehirae TaxID=337451 RepID=A0A3S3MUG6_9MAGN|nr:putative ulp1 protease family, C-terminal catalytic domain-containing protein [Cinnamomum micranthum f. kanehirae]
MRSMEVFWLDSLVRKVVDLNVKFIVNDAMKVAAMEMGKKIKGNPTWELVKCPKQTGKKECGVYVMKFMKHLMEDSLVSSKSKLKELGEAATYGDEELNDL